MRHAKTTRDQVNEAVNRLNQVGARLYGVVVNMVAKRAVGSYYYYYYEETSPTGKSPGKRAKAGKGGTDKDPKVRRRRGDDAPPADTTEA